MDKVRNIIGHCTQRILELQQDDGRIFWIDGGIFDPWNHVLSAMALGVGGEHKAADRAFAVLVDIQHEDGALPGQCGASVPLDTNNRHLLAQKAQPLLDTNFTGFLATGLWHHYRLHHDREWLSSYLKPLRKAVAFVLAHQSPHGEIAWRRCETHETLEEVDALRTGNCSLFKSLSLAGQIFTELGEPDPRMEQITRNIKNALLHKPWRFDRTWDSKDRYAMDWYYPVLSGVISGDPAQQRLAVRMSDFVDTRYGCRCVNDQPWFTAAETCELVIALLAIGKQDQAQRLLETLSSLQADEGGYWMGWQSEEQIYWPCERPSWTAAAMVLALDAIHVLSPASRVLMGVHELEALQDH